MILSKKKRDDALKRITAVSIIVTESIKEPDSFYMAIDNLTEIAFDVGGIKGLTKVKNTIQRYGKDESNDKN